MALLKSDIFWPHVFPKLSILDELAEKYSKNKIWLKRIIGFSELFVRKHGKLRKREEQKFYTTLTYVLNDFENFSFLREGPSSEFGDIFLEVLDGPFNKKNRLRYRIASIGYRPGPNPDNIFVKFYTDPILWSRQLDSVIRRKNQILLMMKESKKVKIKKTSKKLVRACR